MFGKEKKKNPEKNSEINLEIFFFLEILHLSKKNATFLPKSNEYVKLFYLSQAPNTSSHATLHGSWKKVHDNVFKYFDKKAIFSTKIIE